MKWKWRLYDEQIKRKLWAKIGVRQAADGSGG
jgi:hypothetical protein